MNYMFSVLSRRKEGYRFYYVLADGERNFSGGMTEEGELVCDPACPQKELFFRTLVFRCMNEGTESAWTRDVWGLDLTRFGFVPEGGKFTGCRDSFRLPHDCGEK